MKTLFSLGDDILVFICVISASNELLTLSETCKRMKQLLKDRDEVLYKPLLRNVLATKPFNRPLGSLISRVNNLTVNYLQNRLSVLNSKYTATSNIEEMRQTFLLHCLLCPAYFGGEWKATYYYTIRYFKRQAISKTELCGIPWVFRFKTQPTHHLFNCRFLADNTVVSDVHDGRLDYREVSPGVFQVEQFPYLRSSRSEDGSWRLEDPYVELWQIHQMDGGVFF